MSTLLRKDLPWLAAFLAAGIVVHAIASLDLGFAGLWVIPGDGFCDYHFHLWWKSGMVIGVFGALWDSLQGTGEYLRHRPIGSGRIFGVKIAACLFVIVAWLILSLVLPVVLPAVFPGMGAHFRSVAQWSRIWTFLGAGTISLSAFAIATFAVSLRVPWLMRIITGAAAEFALIQTSLELMRPSPGEWSASLGLYVVVQLALTAVLLTVAARNVRTGSDPDRPLALGDACLSGALATTALVLGTGFLLTYLAQFAQWELFKSWPHVGKDPSGRIAMFTWKWGDFVDGLLYPRELDERHRPVRLVATAGSGSGSGSVPVLYSPTSQLGKDRRDRFQGPTHRPNSRIQPFTRRCFLDGYWEWLDFAPSCTYLHLPSGRVLRFATPVGRPGRVVHIRKEADPRPFSSRAQVFGRSEEFVLIGEPGEGSLWISAKDTSAFRRVALPGGDRFRDWTCMTKEEADHFRELTEYSRLNDTADRFVIIGDKALYVWQGGRPVKAPAGIRSKLTSGQGVGAGPYRCRVTRSDSVALTVEVLNKPGDTVVFAHQYGPYTSYEKLHCGLLYLAGLIRPSIFTAYSAVTLASDPRIAYAPSSLFEPLVSGGRRLWLLLVSHLISIGLAWLAARRLIRLGADRARTAFWIGAVVLGGLAAYVIYRAVETRRAYRQAPILKPEQAPPMLIRSA